MVNKMIFKNSKKSKQNLDCACIDYKEAFDSVSHEYIVRYLKNFKVSP